MDVYSFTESQFTQYLFRVAGGEPVNDVLLEVALDQEAERAPQAKR